MPLYEYQCDKCEDVTEKLVSHSLPEAEKEEQPCASCGSLARRKISLSKFELKGKWYRTTKSY